MRIYTPWRSDNEIEQYEKMELIYFSNEFPRDDLQILLNKLHNHSKDRRHPLLARFLDEATISVRKEVRLLPSALRALIPPFESILNFAGFTDLRSGQLCGCECKPSLRPHHKTRRDCDSMLKDDVDKLCEASKHIYRNSPRLLSLSLTH